MIEVHRCVCVHGLARRSHRHGQGVPVLRLPFFAVRQNRNVIGHVQAAARGVAEAGAALVLGEENRDDARHRVFGQQAGDGHRGLVIRAAGNGPLGERRRHGRHGRGRPDQNHR